MCQQKFVIYCFLTIIQRDELRQKKEPELYHLISDLRKNTLSPFENSTMYMDKDEYWAQPQTHLDNIQSVPRSKHTPSRLYKPVS